MSLVSVRRSFVLDLEAQLVWLRAQGLDDRVEGLRAGLAEARALLSRLPRAGAAVEERAGVELRKLLLRKLPFVVWYVVEDGEVVLLRLFHVRQDRSRPRRRSGSTAPRPRGTR